MIYNLKITISEKKKSSSNWNNNKTNKRFLKKDSFGTKDIHKKVKKLSRAKRKIEIPSIPTEKYKFKKSKPNLYLITSSRL